MYIVKSQTDMSDRYCIIDSENMHFQVYNFMLWISLIVTMIISLLVLAFIRSRIESNNMIREIFHEFIRVWGIFCQQGISGGE